MSLLLTLVLNMGGGVLSESGRSISDMSLSLSSSVSAW